MNFATRSAALLLMMTTGFAAQAASPQSVLKLTNDRDANFSQVLVVTDAQGNAHGLVYAQHDVSSGQVTSKNFTLQQLGAGAVLEEEQGVQALILTGSVDAAHGGTLDFSFVANGLTHDYKDCKIGLVKNGANWGLVNATTGARVQTAKIITWQMGVTTLQGICPN